MRGPQPTYVTDTATLNAPMDKDTPPMLGQELLYNINLVVDMMEVCIFCLYKGRRYYGVNLCVPLLTFNVFYVLLL